VANPDKKDEEPMPDFSDVQSGASSTAPAAKVYETYVVVKGDSLSKIAKRVYGRANDWKRIFEANTDILKDPNKIFPGQKLKIPAADDKEKR
jgi:nucleoid-associated protein YgaU